eukprot:366415-Chlamydomonas_euryale.AAC.9
MMHTHRSPLPEARLIANLGSFGIMRSHSGGPPAETILLLLLLACAVGGLNCDAGTGPDAALDGFNDLGFESSSGSSITQGGSGTSSSSSSSSSSSGMSSIGRPAGSVRRGLHATDLSTLVFTPADTGVMNCTMSVSAEDFPELAGAGLPKKPFLVHIILRFFRGKRSDRLKVQGAMGVDPPFEERVKPDGIFDGAHLFVDPRLVLAEAGPDGRATWKIDAPLSFPVAPIVQTAMVSPIHAALTAPQAGKQPQEFTISIAGGGPGRTCLLRPHAVPNRIDPRGWEAEPLAEHAPETAVVVIKPPYNVNHIVIDLLVRHMQHYASIGFTKWVARAVIARRAQSWPPGPLLLGVGCTKWAARAVVAWHTRTAPMF